MFKRVAFLLVAMAFIAVEQAGAFCGFYVAKADTKLFNKASKVALVRDGERTVLTMANDFQGDLKEFAIVVPVPTFLEREQINVADSALLDHLDAYTAPRLVEYFDDDPCNRRVMMERMAMPMAAAGSAMEDGAARAKSLGVTIEAQYTVGEYDILILSAQESDGLETWLKENGYKLPNGAASVLGSYIKQKNRFFVAKVNLEEQSKLGFTYLRPLQVAFESPKFMLPIRLGTLNADGDQELFVFGLTKTGRIETSNYRTVKLPTGSDIPGFVKEDFGSFYKAMFNEQVKRENGRTVFLEYAWDMGWCDPCAADPLSSKELKRLGVFWLGDEGSGPQPLPGQPRIMPPFPTQGENVFVTRLHVRYNSNTFPEDLMFTETGDRSNFQGRYVLRHPYTGKMECPAANNYKREVAERQEQEVKTLASLTGWEISELRAKAALPKVDQQKTDKWWKELWR